MHVVQTINADFYSLSLVAALSRSIWPWSLGYPLPLYWNNLKLINPKPYQSFESPELFVFDYDVSLSPVSHMKSEFLYEIQSSSPSIFRSYDSSGQKLICVPSIRVSLKPLRYSKLLFRYRDLPLFIFCFLFCSRALNLPEIKTILSCSSSRRFTP